MGQAARCLTVFIQKVADLTWALWNCLISHPRDAINTPTKIQASSVCAPASRCSLRSVSRQPQQRIDCWVKKIPSQGVENEPLWTFGRMFVPIPKNLRRHFLGDQPAVWSPKILASYRYIKGHPPKNQPHFFTTRPWNCTSPKGKDGCRTILQGGKLPKIHENTWFELQMMNFQFHLQVMAAGSMLVLGVVSLHQSMQILFPSFQGDKTPKEDPRESFKRNSVPRFCWTTPTLYRCQTGPHFTFWTSIRYLMVFWVHLVMALLMVEKSD